jgi:hypothetical protein
VLIAAFKGEPIIRECALAILSDPSLDFYYSPLLKLEVTLLPTHHGFVKELAFYDLYFRNSNIFGNLNHMFEIGRPEALKHGITVIDVLHLAAAKLSRCRLFITTEKPSRSKTHGITPLFRTTLVKVVSIATMTQPSQARALLT